MITNFLATLLITVSTNWVSVSIEHPAPKPFSVVMTLEYRPIIEHQVGTIFSNTVARIPWKNEFVDAILESIEIGTIRRSRDYMNGMIYSK